MARRRAPARAGRCPRAGAAEARRRPRRALPPRSPSRAYAPAAAWTRCCARSGNAGRSRSFAVLLEIDRLPLRVEQLAHLAGRHGDLDRARLPSARADRAPALGLIRRRLRRAGVHLQRERERAHAVLYVAPVEWRLKV